MVRNILFQLFVRFLICLLRCDRISNFYSSFDTSCSNFTFVSSFVYSDVIASQTFTHRSIHLVSTFHSFPHLFSPMWIASQTFTHRSIHLVPTFRSFPHLFTPM